MKLHGKNGSVTLNGTTVSYAAEWSINVTRQYADVSVFGDNGVVLAAGLRSVEGSFSGLFNSSGDEVWSAAATSGTVTVAVLAANGTTVASGPAWVDVSATAAVGDAVKCSGTFKSSGAWSPFS